MESKICSNCGIQFEKYAKPAKNYFCSFSCYNEFRIGDQNGNWKGGDISFNCKECNKKFTVRRDRISKQKGDFCSKECYVKHIQKNKMSYIQKRLSKQNIKNLLYWLRFNSKIKTDWIERYGYNPDEFKNHIESLFKKGMTWQNYGLWELDHIRPIYTFRFESNKDKEFKKCFALNNLQPLWKIENSLKGRKYDQHLYGVR